MSKRIKQPSFFSFKSFPTFFWKSDCILFTIQSKESKSSECTACSNSHLLKECMENIQREAKRGLDLLGQKAISVDNPTTPADPNLQCSVCNAKFKRKQHLTRHQKRHAPESTWKYHCKFCKKKFYRLDKKTQHEKTHWNT